ncbi:MAG: glucosaminidase domain-containing protein [Candidatus Gastranaerophilales bacterium]|nr:glucosaminidase domain-containing protein [Candidatus Gastranaerophilales bacterium]
MSENYTIGSYTIESKTYYDALVQSGITDDATLKKLDTDGDMVLTEDELISMDLSDSDTTEDTGETSTNSEVEEIEEKYEKQLIALYEELDSLESQRRNIYNKIGTASSDDMAQYISNAEDITSDIKTTRLSIVQTLSNKEAAVEAAQNSASTSSSSSTVSTTSSSGSGTITGTSSVADMMKKVSKFSQGVLADKADYIDELCAEYNIDSALVLAIMSLETGYGTSSAIVNYNNPGGMMKSGSIIHYSSLEEGIEAVIKNLANNYIGQGLTTISEIGAKYCPSSQSWIDSVTSIYNTLTDGNITSGTNLA